MSAFRHERDLVRLEARASNINIIHRNAGLAWSNRAGDFKH
jgi:hypothetical protein